VVKKFSNDIPNIYCEPSQMKEVFINLFSNARDAMPNGGELTIDIKSLFPHQESIMIEISDTGGGIPDDILSQIFNPFFTTKEKGTGLGLAIVKKIINEHGGDIIAKNNGRGGSFIITLPAPL
jgi:two-component system, sporulation sensor kinase E